MVEKYVIIDAHVTVSWSGQPKWTLRTNPARNLRRSLEVTAPLITLTNWMRTCWDTVSNVMLRNKALWATSRYVRHTAARATRSIRRVCLVISATTSKGSKHTKGDDAMTALSHDKAKMRNTMPKWVRSGHNRKRVGSIAFETMLKDMTMTITMNQWLDNPQD